MVTPPLEREAVCKLFPRFPHLTLEQFGILKDLGVRGALGNDNPCAIGSQTVQFLKMCFKRPVEVLAGLTLEYVDGSAAYRRDMAYTYGMVSI